MNILLSKENREKIVIVAYVIYLAELIVFDTMFGKINSLQPIFSLIRLTCYALVCGKVFLDLLTRTFSNKEIVGVGCVTLLFIAVMFTTGNKAMLIYWIFIVAMRDIEFERIIKLSFWIHVICLLLVISSSWAGIIENRIYGTRDVRIRQSLGFQYTTESCNYWLYMVLMWVYIRKDKVTWGELGLMVLVDVYLFQCTRTKSACALALVAVAGAVVLKTSAWLRRYKKLYSLVAVGIVPSLAVWIIDISRRFDPNVDWMNKLNTILTTRLSLGYEAYHNYGIHLLGQRIEWVGGTNKFDTLEKAYNYVDSSFVQILINFGPIILGLLLLSFVALGVKISKNKDTYFVLVLAVLAVHSTFDPQIIWMEYNAFVMMYSYFKDSSQVKCVGHEVDDALIMQHYDLQGLCSVECGARG